MDVGTDVSHRRVPSQIHAHIVAQPAHGRERATRQHVDRWGGGTAEQPERVVAAEQCRGEVDDVAVDEPGGVEGVGDGGPAFDQQLQHSALSEIVEHGAKIAGQLEAGVDPGAGRRPTEDDPQRVAPGDVAHGEGRVVATHGAAPTSTASLSARRRWTSAGPPRR